MSQAVSGAEGRGVGLPGIASRGLGPAAAPAPPVTVVPGPREPADPLARPLRVDQLPLLVLTGPATAHLPEGAVPVVPGLERRRVQHAVAGRVRRSETISGVRLALSETGMDRVAGLVALGADHTRGCLGASGVSLSDATRYAARLERLGLRAESAWHSLAEGYYVLDAEPWNLRRLVDEHTIASAEDLLGTLPATEATGRGPASWLVLLGPTCATADS